MSWALQHQILVHRVFHVKHQNHKKQKKKIEVFLQHLNISILISKHLFKSTSFALNPCCFFASKQREVPVSVPLWNRKEKGWHVNPLNFITTPTEGRSTTFCKSVFMQKNIFQNCSWCEVPICCSLQFKTTFKHTSLNLYMCSVKKSWSLAFPSLFSYITVFQNKVICTFHDQFQSAWMLSQTFGSTTRAFHRHLWDIQKCNSVRFNRNPASQVFHWGTQIVYSNLLYNFFFHLNEN